LVDFTASGVLLVILAPLLVGISVGILVADGWPIFFVQERIGVRDCRIRVVKFRTMRSPRPGEEASDFDGERMTRMGRFLRTSSLDELPSLCNVVVGQMSLVGPRPLPVRYLERYSSIQRRRHEVRPGITGWAQVNGRNTIEWDEKFAFDVWYVEHRSFRLDLRTLVMTVSQVIRREGISHEGHSTMPEFLGTSGDTRDGSADVGK
jgi:lipopolysaccharide/colanic/teichoic acid biosynthesis glycosyltransferase